MTTTSTAASHRHAGRFVTLSLRWIVAASLIVDALVHLHLAGGYQQSAPGGIGAGNLFRIQAAVALLVALWVFWRGSRAAFVAAFIVGFSAVVVVVLYRYVDVPALGPLPAMYEPVWFFEKSLSAVAEAVAALAAVAALVALPRQKHR